MSEALVSRGRFRYYWVASAPSPPYRAKHCCPTSAVRQPSYLPYIGGPWALRPRLTTGLPFSLTHTQGCACLATNTSYIGSQAHAIKAWRNFREGPKGEVRRISIPHTPVNKGMRKGRGCYEPRPSQL